MKPHSILVALGLTLLPCATPSDARTAPVTFLFSIAPDIVADPFAAAIWGEVELPSGKTLRLPAFPTADERFAVRAHADQAGVYHWKGALLSESETPHPITSRLHSPAAVAVDERAVRPFIRLDPDDPRRFRAADGNPYFPLGANLAWRIRGDVVRFYANDFRAFRARGLNWTRIWMCHWGELNLDWHPRGAPSSPEPGAIDPAAAQRWDRIVELAEQHGVYVQMVLQHHGQYSTEVNPNWEDNPWNAANPGGFLETPADFFTSSRARELTKRKYRYIVARWGYSPAVLAWELFNEVHWVDALRLEDDLVSVAAWHEEMAAYLRSIDPYEHFVITSCDPATNPLFDGMDYRQPHLYAPNMLVAVQQYEIDPAALRRPIFYGEFGQDNMPLSEEVKRAGSHLAPPVWASILGTGTYAAQPWEGHRIIQTRRLRELGAVAKFVAATRLAERTGLRHFAPRLESETRVPLRISAGHNWQKKLSPEIDIPLDGRLPLELVEIPMALVGSPRSIAEGYPNRITFHLDAPRALNGRIEFGGAGRNGAQARLLIDGQPIAERQWRPGAEDRSVDPIQFQVPAGNHVITLENNGGPDWFAFSALQLDIAVPVLTATGKRNDDFIAAWIWHRDNVFATAPRSEVSGSLSLEDVPAGNWNVTWWDSTTGAARPAAAINHTGGDLTIDSPPIARHAAVTLERSIASP